MDNYATQSYVPGGSQTVASASGYAAPYANPYDQLTAIVKARQAKQNQAAHAAQPQYSSPQQAQAVEYVGSRNSGGLGAAPNPGLIQRRPMYVKMITSPGAVPGYAPAQPTDPGAVFAGYLPDGAQLPSSASFATAPGPVGGYDRGPDLYSPGARAYQAGPQNYTYYRGGQEIK